MAPSAEWVAKFVPASGAFDLVIAAECIYTGIDSADEQEGREPYVLLAETIDRLSGSQTQVFVCSMERHDAGGGGTSAAGVGAGHVSVVQAFTELMKARGFLAKVEWTAVRPPNPHPWLIRFWRHAVDKGGDGTIVAAVEVAAVEPAPEMPQGVVSS